MLKDFPSSSRRLGRKGLSAGLLDGLLRSIERIENSEIIVICDGSPDGTDAAVIEEFGLELIYSVEVGRGLRVGRQPPVGIDRSDLSLTGRKGWEDNKNHIRIKPIEEVWKRNRITLIKKVNGGKGDALNAGINMAAYKYVLCLDANSYIDSHSMLCRLLMPFDYLRRRLKGDMWGVQDRR